jgi:hypothetical protein
VLSLVVYGQISINYPIDIMSGINNSTVELSIDPEITTGDSTKIFDGNEFTSGGISSSDSLSFLFHFLNPVKIGKCKTYFWNNGHWNLKAANSYNDLINQNGSYISLVKNKSNSFFTWDSVSFETIEISWMIFSAVNLQDSSVIVGEFQLFEEINIHNLLILPVTPKLIPGTSLPLEVKLVDDQGSIYPYLIDDHVYWTSADQDIVTVDEFGEITGHALGTAEITAYTNSGLDDTTIVEVVEDFQSTNAGTLHIKVALVLQNPVIDLENNRRIHEVWRWTNPMTYINEILEEFSQMSGGVVQFEIVETYDNDNIFTTLDTTFMTIDTVAYYFMTPGMLYGRNTEGTLQNLAEIQGRVHFDYNAMVDRYDFDTKRNNGDIHEIWVYSFPFSGMYESQLMGPNAFWYNSPPLDHLGLEKLLSVMGWNYERGVAEAIHSFGHRAESAIRHIYGRWDIHNPNPNNWELFTRIDKEIPGGAHIGNIHFPPNGQSDYDYGNTSYVDSYADNWKRYPILLDQKRSVNRDEWEAVNSNYQLGFMRWWHNHLPRYTGVTDTILNNWWHYIVDYEDAVERAYIITQIDNGNNVVKILPDEYSLKQNYPNPFNPQTTIKFNLNKDSRVVLTIFDVLGREVRTLIDERKKAGEYKVTWYGKDNLGNTVASGFYLYRLKAGDVILSKKMIFLK